MSQINASTSQQIGQAKIAETPRIPLVNLETGYAYFEGHIIPLSEAKVSVATHALNYGTACYEGIRAYWNSNQKQLYLLKLREHYQRMAYSCNLLHMHPKESVDDLCRITIELLRMHDYKQNVYIRPLSYKSSCTIRLALSELEDSIAIYTFPMGNYIDTITGLTACTSSWRRANSNAMPIRAKVSGAYVNSSLAIDDARRAGFDEAILLTQDGTVSETSSSNLFIMRNGKLITPALSEDILEGITRLSLIDMIRTEFGITVEERRIDRTELYASDEIFICGTGIQILPIVSVDYRPVGNGTPGSFTMTLQALYLSSCYGENDKYRDWVTPVYERDAGKLSSSNE